MNECLFCDGQQHLYGVMAKWYAGCDCLPLKMPYHEWRGKYARGRLSKRAYRRRQQTRRRYLRYLAYRDGPGCRICGTLSKLTVDHIIPKSKGGSSNMNNYQLLCNDCNVKKGDTLPI